MKATRQRSLSTALLALCCASCSQPQVIVPASLDSPRAMTVVRGLVCMSSVEVAEGILEPVLSACPDATRGAIGLVVNDQINRVAVIDMTMRQPRLLDLDPTTPGVNHIPVGGLPVAVTANLDGTMAYVANQRGRTLSAINMWHLRALDDTLTLPGAPVALSHSAATDQLVVALAEPAALWLASAGGCEAPTSGVDRLSADPGAGCDPRADDGLTLALPGTPTSLIMHPGGAHAYISYLDRPFLSIVALDASASAEPCLGQSAGAACEVARIGLTTGCADGLDNDGDGLTDRDDPQCFSPYHAESPGGISRAPVGTCADGIDNDGDGLTDRADPSCLSGADDEGEPPLMTPLGLCNDGLDNDGDGRSDLADPGCYGPYGQTERDLPKLGFGQLGIDELGKLLYVLDAPNRQALVVNLDTRALLDAPRQAKPVDPFSDPLGVRLGRTPTPSAVVGRVRRTLTPDPRPAQANTHALMRYDLGAYVAADTGLIYYIDVATIRCDLYEPTGILSMDAFYDDPQARDASVEARCLALDGLGAPAAEDAIPSCTAVLLCKQCQDAGGDDCAQCDGLGDIEAQVGACQLPERFFERGLTRQTLNTRLSLRDVTSAQSGVVGRATCDIPHELSAELQRLATERELSASQGCGSTLLPQPLSATVISRGEQRPLDFLGAQRLDLIEQRTLELEMDEAGQVRAVSVIGVNDERVLDEEIAITYEGVLPGAAREDGLASDDPDDLAAFTVGGLDVCRADVQPGDLLVIRTSPAQASGCEAYISDAPNFLSWRIMDARPGRLSLETIDAMTPQGARRFSDALPSRACFPTGITYEVRAADAWVVQGSSSGVASPNITRGDRCVPNEAGAAGRAVSRVATGDRYVGPYYSFTLYPGEVAPARDLSYQLQVRRAFSPASLETGEQLVTRNPRTSQLVFARALTRGTFIMALDPGDSVIFARNLATRDNAFGIR